ncbi:MAG: TAT-variant-translocated molybdopterin oxidoreductase [Planctomycetes bacterium]|nr:TAT-variant-translocated molybdopterin oxidoreductase [Planctomycetota bacterium]
MPPLNEPTSARPVGPSYWRSLDHLADTSQFREFMHREFPAGASELLDGDDRRHFLKIMGASMALAGLGLAGCRRWPEEKIVPFASRPAGRDPGVPVHYATCHELGGVARGVLATANDGRPTKIEGNPNFPTSAGAADVFAQASILDLYDPDRSRSVLHDGEEVFWADFLGWSEKEFRKLRNKRGHGIALLTEATSSPSAQALKAKFLEQLPNAKWYEYEPVNNDNEVAGSQFAFGAPYRVSTDYARARAIIALDADILGPHPNSVQNIRNFARGRNVDAGSASHVDSEMSRLYAFESAMTLTGANADERIAVRSTDVAVIAAWLAARVLGDDSLKRFEDDPTGKAVLTETVVRRLNRVLNDLNHSKGRSVIVAGSRQPAEVHMLVHLMNAELGNVGTTVHFASRPDDSGHAAAIAELVKSKVQTLLIVGGNPVYDAPADLDFGTWLDGVKTTIHLSPCVDETSARCTWHVNRAHYLEAWTDGRAWDGTYCIGQPVIEPLFGGRTPVELLAIVVGDEERYAQNIVRRTFREMVGSDDEHAWRTMLHDGYLPGSGSGRERPTARRGGIASATGALFDAWKASGDGWEAVFATDPTLYDGRFANNGWLQEMPDPITRLTWDNAVLIGTAAAEALGVETGDNVTVTAGGSTVEAAVMVIPGIADRSAVLPLGYGRSFEGRICTGAGFDFYRLRTTEAMGILPGITIEKSRGSYVLATVQDHHTIDVESVGGRGVQQRLPSLFREAELEEYKRDPKFAAHRTHVVHRLSLWEETNLEGAEYAWGMTVDLNACVGCGACVVACQAENNIPIVGKEQVAEGREMHWMRVDRYFTFAEHDGHFDPNEVVNVGLQPVLCMHCENAPCESVCPVAATTHDADGLNVMVYNRCVGTRYCSNNCPYKVRRFNYFDYHRRKPYREKDGLLHVDETYFEREQATPTELESLQFNPEVTVRMRGIMEKCTYCVQRISRGKIDAKNAFVQKSEAEKQAAQRVPVPDGAIKPACVQTCPAEALVFGDLNDPNSEVTKSQRGPRSYEMLEELNVKARTQYLAKVRNPAISRGGSGGSH